MQSAIEAEQALLGAILCDPAGQHDVLDLVEPGDMLRPWHGQVVAAMHRLRRRGQHPSAERVYRELQHDPDLPHTVALDAVPLAGLMAAAPRPGHAQAYAAIVIEAEIRRRLQLNGSRLVQAAESGDLDTALAQAARAQADLAACAARWAALPCPVRTSPSAAPRTSLEKPPPRPTATGQFSRLRNPPLIHNNAVSAHPASSASDDPLVRTTPGDPIGEATAGRLGRHAGQSGAPAAAASVVALRDLIDDPSQLDAVGTWLRPGHFARPAYGRLYVLLHDMHAARQPIDPVTVAWEAARRGLRTTPGRLSGGTGAFAVADAREVHRLGTLTQITRAGASIQSDAADPARSPPQLLHTAAHQLDPLVSEPQPGPDLAPAAGRVRHPRPVAAPNPCQPEPEAAR
ncbi:MAG: DnaB-like helicase N-terminal domain-containing protein [Streptosporangiaceae bacterium]